MPSVGRASDRSPERRVAPMSSACTAKMNLRACSSSSSSSSSSSRPPSRWVVVTAIATKGARSPPATSATSACPNSIHRSVQLPYNYLLANFRALVLGFIETKQTSKQSSKQASKKAITFGPFQKIKTNFRNQILVGKRILFEEGWESS